MARAMNPNSGGSQFFIMHKAAPHLDGAYAAFGKVLEGMDVVNRIAEEDTDYSDRPWMNKNQIHDCGYFWGGLPGTGEMLSIFC